MKGLHAHIAVHDLAQGDKYWTLDPQGLAWELFRTLDSIPVFGADTRPEPNAGTGACCAPATM